MGGTDDPSNLVMVTEEEHAELHFALYLEHGDWRDYRAAMGLAKLGGVPCFAGQKHTEETRAKMSRKLKGRKMSQAHKDAIGRANRGKKRSSEMKAQVSATLRSQGADVLSARGRHAALAKQNKKR